MTRLTARIYRRTQSIQMNFRLIRISLRERRIREKSQAQRQCVEILHDYFVSHLKGSRVVESKFRKTPDRHSFLCTWRTCPSKTFFHANASFLTSITLLFRPCARHEHLPRLICRRAGLPFSAFRLAMRGLRVQACERA
jgi:hypothetical protein